MKVENAIWKEAKYKPPCRKGLPESKSVKALKAMKVGDVKRIFHGDVACKKCGEQCTLTSTISRLRTTSRGRTIYKYYHEDTGIIVVKRVS
jgi:hypothetical protein